MRREPLNERLVMKGRLVELEEQANYLKTKIEGSSKIVRENCSLSLKGSYDQLDDQTIKVFSSELVNDIRSLREINEKTQRLQQDLGENK